MADLIRTIDSGNENNDGGDGVEGKEEDFENFQDSFEFETKNNQFFKGLLGIKGKNEQENEKQYNDDKQKVISQTQLKSSLKVTTTQEKVQNRLQQKDKYKQRQQVMQKNSSKSDFSYDELGIELEDSKNNNNDSDPEQEKESEQDENEEEEINSIEKEDLDLQTNDIKKGKNLQKKSETTSKVGKSEKVKKQKKQLIIEEKNQKAKVKELNWQKLGLCKPLLKALEDLEFEIPTLVQQQAIPAIMSGRDVLASSVTGSGKTAAFCLPILERFKGKISTNYTKALIVTPARELALQCFEMLQQLNKYLKLRVCLIIGGASMQKQEVELRQYPDIIIATPGRLIDHLQNTQSMDLDDLEVLIFDEADKLLELGFMAEIQEIIKNCSINRQTLLFSATLTSDVNKLSTLTLKKPIRVQANPDGMTADTLQQYILKIMDDNMREGALIYLADRFSESTLIFFRTKSQCHRMAIILGLVGKNVCELHGNLSQAQRIQAFEDFKEGKYKYLLATDLAARGLDIKELKTVINYELPQEVTRYIHRVGRTARAGEEGRCISICNDNEHKKLKRMLKQSKESLNKLKYDLELVQSFKQKIKGLENDISAIYKSEGTEKQLRKAEMEIEKADNLMKYSDDIYNRPKKTWFQSNKQRNDIKKQAKEEIDQIDDQGYKQQKKKFKKR